jgi:hypothetical protein
MALFMKKKTRNGLILGTIVLSIVIFTIFIYHPIKESIYYDAGNTRYSMSCIGQYECDFSIPNQRCDNLMSGVNNQLMLRNSPLPTCTDENNIYSKKNITIVFDDGRTVNSKIQCGDTESTYLYVPIGWGDVKSRCGNNFNNYAGISGHISIKNVATTTTITTTTATTTSSTIQQILIDPPKPTFDFSKIMDVINDIIGRIIRFLSFSIVGENNTTSIYLGQPITMPTSLITSNQSDTNKTDGKLSWFFKAYVITDSSNNIIKQESFDAISGTNALIISYTPTKSGTYYVVALLTEITDRFDYSSGTWIEDKNYGILDQYSQTYIVNDIPTPPKPIFDFSSITQFISGILDFFKHLFGG